MGTNSTLTNDSIQIIDKNPSLLLSVSEDGSSQLVLNPNGEMDRNAPLPSDYERRFPKRSALLYVDKDGGPILQLNDSTGFQFVLGVSKLVTTRTGENQTTSAASLVMTNKEGNVIWRAP
jgi:hypothetical protein